MKPQDLIYFLILVSLIIYKRGQYAWHAGMVCFLGSGSLFVLGNLYTSQRLAWYGAAFMLLAVAQKALSFPKN